MIKQYYYINEETARRAKEAFSFSDYVSGSATQSYCRAVDKIWALAEERKAKGDLSEGDEERIEKYADRYARRLADWTNRHNANIASCPSWMVSGGSNFPVAKKEKQNAREDRLWEEYGDIEKCAEWIAGYGRKSTAIMSGDADAAEKLESKLKDLTDKQTEMKSANAYWRKNGSMKGYADLTDEQAAKLDKEIQESYSWCRQPYPSYKLTNNNSMIRQTRERLETLRREKEAEARTYDTEGLDLRVNENKEIMRLQIFFKDKPDEGVRTLLKSRAFRWSPSGACWQRQLTNAARYDLEKILKQMKEVTA